MQLVVIEGHTSIDQYELHILAITCTDTDLASAILADAQTA